MKQHMGFREAIDNLRKANIVCWGIGRHFYSSTYIFMKRNNLLSRVYLLIDKSVPEIDSNKASELVGCNVLSPETASQHFVENTIILISVSNYDSVIESINANPNLNGISWIPDKYLIMLQKDEDLLNTVKPSPNYHRFSDIRIPKVINTFWFSNEPIPDRYQCCINSWKKYCPDYEIRIWSLLDYNSRGNRYFEEAISVGKWAFASDYSRIDVISEHGGIYMDLDVEVVKPIDDLLYNDAYMGFEDCERIDCGSGFGATPGNELLMEIRERYANRSFIRPDGTYDQTICPVIYTGVLLEHGLQTNGSFQDVDGITVYPFEYLSAKSFMSGIVYRTENTYTIHHHEGGWLSEESKKINNSRYYDVMNYIGLF